MSELKGACVIGQSGGPTSVINSSVLGALEAALDNPSITRVFGMAHGIKGLLNDDLYDIDKEDRDELALLRYTPSSALGSCRYKLADPDVDDTDYKRILEIFKKYDIRYFFYNGGNDSMGSLSLYMPRETIAELFGDEGKVFLFVPADFISGNFHFHIPLFGNAQAGCNVCFCALKCLHHSALVRIFVY